MNEKQCLRLESVQKQPYANVLQNTEAALLRSSYEKVF